MIPNLEVQQFMYDHVVLERMSFFQEVARESAPAYRGARGPLSGHPLDPNLGRLYFDAAGPRSDTLLELTLGIESRHRGLDEIIRSPSSTMRLPEISFSNTL